MTFSMWLVWILKAVIIVHFGMILGVLLTWTDRRQGAMMQDRVGPERAVIWIPKLLARILLLAPAVAAAGGLIAMLIFSDVSGPAKTNRAMLLSHGGIFLTWFTALAIAGRVRKRGPRNSFDQFLAGFGDPRRFLYLGLGAHVFAILAAGMMKGTPAGTSLRDVAYGAGVGVLAVSMIGGALYAALSIRGEKAGLRALGLLHGGADGIKTLFKEDFIPPGSDRFLHSLAPFIAFFPVLVVLAVVPFGDTLCFGSDAAGKLDLLKPMTQVPRDGTCADHFIKLQMIDLNVGVLYFFAMAGTGIVGAGLAGWASDNKYSLLGGLRAASQMVSYEVTLGLTLIGALMIYGTPRLDEMVRWQSEHTWGIFAQPLAFFLFFAASIAETKRIPFDLPEGESELVAGYFTEYSGMKFAMFFFSEYVAVVTSSALIAVIFLGGWDIPFVVRDGLHIAVGDSVLYSQPMSHVFIVIIGVLAFVAKTVGLCVLQLAIRWTLPRFRYDQLMKLGWRKLLPASLVNILITGVIVLALDGAGIGTQGVLRFLGDATDVIVAASMFGLLIWFVLFLVKPVKKKQYSEWSAAEYAQATGGTRAAKMGA